MSTNPRTGSASSSSSSGASRRRDIGEGITRHTPEAKVEFRCSDRRFAASIHMRDNRSRHPPAQPAPHRPYTMPYATSRSRSGTASDRAAHHPRSIRILTGPASTSSDERTSIPGTDRVQKFSRRDMALCLGALYAATTLYVLFAWSTFI